MTSRLLFYTQLLLLQAHISFINLSALSFTLPWKAFDFSLIFFFSSFCLTSGPAVGGFQKKLQLSSADHRSPGCGPRGSCCSGWVIEAQIDLSQQQKAEILTTSGLDAWQSLFHSYNLYTWRSLPPSSVCVQKPRTALLTQYMKRCAMGHRWLRWVVPASAASPSLPVMRYERRRPHPPHPRPPLAVQLCWHQSQRRILTLTVFFSREKNSKTN